METVGKMTYDYFMKITSGRKWKICVVSASLLCSDLRCLIEMADLKTEEHMVDETELRLILDTHKMKVPYFFSRGNKFEWDGISVHERKEEELERMRKKSEKKDQDVPDTLIESIPDALTSDKEEKLLWPKLLVRTQLYYRPRKDDCQKVSDFVKEARIQNEYENIFDDMLKFCKAESYVITFSHVTKQNKTGTPVKIVLVESKIHHTMTVEMPCEDLLKLLEVLDHSVVPLDLCSNALFLKGVSENVATKMEGFRHISFIDGAFVM